MDSSFPRSFDSQSDWLSRQCMRIDDPNDRWLMRLLKACNRNDLASVQALVESCEEGTLCGIVHEVRDTPLHRASIRGNMAIVKYLVESDRIKVDVNLQDRFGMTAIHRVCRNGRTAIVKYLMESDRVDVDFNIRDWGGNTSMHIASKRGDRDTIEYFMQSDRSDVDVNTRNNKGQTLLHLACRSGKRDLVEYLMESDRIHFIMDDTDGNSLLHHACEQGHIDVLKYLVQCPQVDAAVNINKQNNKGDTPLHAACREMEISCVRYLVESDDISDSVNLNIRNNHGDTLLHRACCTRLRGSEDMIVYLVHCGKIDTDNHIRTQNNDGDTPLHRLCYYGNRRFLPCLKLLLEEYQPNNDNNEDNSNSELSIDEIFKIQNRHGNTPLHVACKRQERDAIEYLLQSSKTNGSFNIQNHDGDTPVHLAFRRGRFVPLDHTTRLTHLFEFIQHQLIPTTNLSDLSHLNDRVGDTVITKRLIEEAKPIANIQNRAGNTLLHLACMSKESEMPTLQQLVGHGSVDATLQNSDGNTPLHCICYVNTGTGSDTGSDVGSNANDRDDYLEKLKLLIESSNVKVDVNMMNNDGDTVLHRAVKYGLVEVFEYLMMLEEIDGHVRNKADHMALECAQKATYDAKILALPELGLAHHPTAKRDRLNCSPDVSVEGEIETKTKRQR